MANKTYTCPICGDEITIDEEALAAMGHSIVCSGCQSVLRADGDFLYVPTEEESFELVDSDADTPPPFSAENIIDDDDQPALYDHAVEYIATCNAISVPMLMHYFGIDEQEASELMRELEQRGVVGPFTGGPRQILIPHNEGLPTGGRRTFEVDQMQKQLLERMRQAQENGEMPKVRSCTCSLPGLLMLILLGYLIYTLLK
ncbi:MAG: DNA translocase FtsK [Bacteroidales bacterium]|nr:DNA translocase FtsK [Bacteroidales bacterium]